MSDWSIKIIPYGNESAKFVPDLKGAKPGDPLQAQEDDLVTWNNTTDQSHQPWQTDSNFTPSLNGALCDEIPPHSSSRPSYNVPELPTGKSATTIYYCCNLHPDEHGTIQVAGILS